MFENICYINRLMEDEIFVDIVYDVKDIDIRGKNEGILKKENLIDRSLIIVKCKFFNFFFLL